jgi:hypothetical protein
MKPHEIRRGLRNARVEAQAALEDYIQCARNAPHMLLAQALIKARAYNLLLIDPEDKYAHKLLLDVGNNEPYTRSF